jgi:hypothetical protein
MSNLHVSVLPNEIVLAGTAITVTSDEPLDARSAQSAIRLHGQRTAAALSHDGRSATVTIDDQAAAAGGTPAPGNHHLVINELLTPKGDRLADRVVVPFQVTDSVAEELRKVRIESMVRLSVDGVSLQRVSIHERPGGEYIEIVKAADRDSGEPLDLAFDHTGARIDASEFRARALREQLDKFGKLHPLLHDQIEADPARPVSVSIWLQADLDPTLPEKSEKTRTEVRPDIEAANLERIGALSARVSDELAGRFHFELLEADRHAPVLFATVAGEQVRSIAEHPEVAAVLLHETEQILDLGNSIAIANSDDVHNLGFDGTGVNLAVWEDGPDQTNLLPIVATFDPNFNGNSQHARHTHGIVSNTEANKPHGHAPGCSLHSANRGTIDALRWAVKDQGCTVISQSFHRGSEPGNGTLQSDDIYKDWLALHWPYPTIVQAAGNFWQGDSDNIQPPSSEYVNHKTFNCLTVGNHDDTASAMSGDSVFRNPTSTHGDRELPEIAANGTGVTAVGLTMSGTSMAAPAAAGCVALIQDVNSTLQSWPEGCRAIMMAGASKNPSGSTWWADLVAGNDASDGAGAVDALESVRITQARRSRNAPGTRRGWDVGTLRSADIGDRRETTYSYNIAVPRLFRGRAKVALAWDSKVSTFDIFGLSIPLSSTLTVDLDLKVYDSNGNQVGYSGSYDNSYEIAEFDVAPGASYTIKIRRWSGTDDVWYGVAWTLQGGFIFDQVIRGVEIGSIRNRFTLPNG